MTTVTSGGPQPANLSLIHRRNHGLHPDTAMILRGIAGCHHRDISAVNPYQRDYIVLPHPVSTPPKPPPNRAGQQPATWRSDAPPSSEPTKRNGSLISLMAGYRSPPLRAHSTYIPPPSLAASRNPNPYDGFPSDSAVNPQFRPPAHNQARAAGSNAGRVL